MEKTQPDPLVCEWGGDHRETGHQPCAICKIPKGLNDAIKRFSHYQKALELGKTGLMSYHLLRMAMKQKIVAMNLFGEYQTVSKEHPEWHLAQEINRLRTSFANVAEDCFKASNALSRADPCVDYDLSLVLEEDGEPVNSAGDAVFDYYQFCCDSVETHVIEFRPPKRDAQDGFLVEIDDELRKTVDVIKLIPESESVRAHDLTQKAHQMCNDARQILREFPNEDIWRDRLPFRTQNPVQP